MIIRDIEPNDFSEALKCIRKAVDVSNRPDYPEKIINHQLNEHYIPSWIEKTIRGKYFVIAEIQGSIVGTGALKNNEIRNVFVDPDHQRDGIGRAIMNHLELYARNQGHFNILLESSISAISFYRKLSYNIQKDEIIEWLGEKVRRIQMVKVF